MGVLWSLGFGLILLWEVLSVRVSLRLADRRAAWRSEHHMDAAKSAAWALAALSAALMPWMPSEETRAALAALLGPAAVIGPLFYVHLTKRR